MNNYTHCLTLQACLVKTACEQNQELLTPAEKYQLQVYYADALFEQQEYKKAEVSPSVLKYFILVSLGGSKNLDTFLTT